MGGAKRLLEEKEHIDNLAQALLRETGYLEPCEGDHVLLVSGDDEGIEAAYRLANARISSGEIKLSYGYKRRDLTDAIKAAAEEAGEECYTCQKIRNE